MAQLAAFVVRHSPKAVEKSGEYSRCRSQRHLDAVLAAIGVVEVLSHHSGSVPSKRAPMH